MATRRKTQRRAQNKERRDQIVELACKSSVSAAGTMAVMPERSKARAIDKLCKTNLFWRYCRYLSVYPTAGSGGGGQTKKWSLLSWEVYAKLCSAYCAACYWPSRWVRASDGGGDPVDEYDCGSSTGMCPSDNIFPAILKRSRIAHSDFWFAPLDDGVVAEDADRLRPGSHVGVCLWCFKDSPACPIFSEADADSVAITCIPYLEKIMASHLRIGALSSVQMQRYGGWSKMLELWECLEAVVPSLPCDAWIIANLQHVAASVALHLGEYSTQQSPSLLQTLMNEWAAAGKFHKVSPAMRRAFTTDAHCHRCMRSGRVWPLMLWSIRKSGLTEWVMHCPVCALLKWLPDYTTQEWNETLRRSRQLWFVFIRLRSRLIERLSDVYA